MASQKLGGYAFLVALIIAVVAGIVATYMSDMMAGLAGVVTLVLVILGLVVGFLNVHDKHITDFLIATIAVAMVGGTAGGLVGIDLFLPALKIGTLCATVVINIVAIAAAAALVVGLKQIMTIAKEQVQ